MIIAVLLQFFMSQLRRWWVRSSNRLEQPNKRRAAHTDLALLFEGASHPVAQTPIGSLPGRTPLPAAAAAATVAAPPAARTAAEQPNRADLSAVWPAGQGPALDVGQGPAGAAVSDGE
jgi:hypothetical protein